MKKLLKPTWTINSIYNIQPQDLQNHRIKAVLCDLDNTLIAWNQKQATEEMTAWVQAMKLAGIKVYLISNNNHDRVLKVAQPLELPFKASAFKPLPKMFNQAVQELACAKEEIIVIGDQIMTDIIGANTNQLRSILVKPIVPHDNIYTIINRNLEKIAFKIIGIDRKKDWGNKLGS